MLAEEEYDRLDVRLGTGLVPEGLDEFLRAPLPDRFPPPPEALEGAEGAPSFLVLLMKLEGLGRLEEVEEVVRGLDL